MPTTGKWTSPVYDLGSKKRVRVWGDFRCVFSAASQTWETVWPSGSLWSSVDISKSWREIFASDVAGKISAILYWGDADDALIYSAQFFEILAIEIDARYVQVEVNIIDPDVTSKVYLKELNMTAAYWE